MSAIVMVGSSALAQQTFNVDVKGFSGVENNISANVNIYQDANYKVEVITTKSVMDDLKIFVEDGVLRLKTKDNFFNWSNDDKIIVNIWAPSYNSLVLNGSGNVLAKTAISTKDLVVRINGSGDVNIIKLEASSLVVKSNGSGDVLLSGDKALESAEYNINGSGDIDVAGLSCKKVSVHINGSGDVNVWATDELLAKVVGSGDVEIKGNPRIDAKVIGSGSIKRK